MKSVSAEYKASMKDIIRNKSHIRIFMGLYNVAAQDNAEIIDEGLEEYSNLSTPLNNGFEGRLYASYEDKMAPVDRSVYFMPRDITQVLDTGATTKPLISDNPSILIKINHDVPLDFKGVTIDFGKNFPIKFRIVTDNETIEFTNDKPTFLTEHGFIGVTFMRIEPIEMLYGNTRLRVYSIGFGIGITYTDDKIVSANLKSTISPTNEDLPTMDLNFTIENMDRYYNIENEDSAINFIETGQRVEVTWGYDLEDTTEWLHGATLLMKSWKSNDKTAEFSAGDKLEYLDEKYTKGEYNPDGITFYDLAENVMIDAGLSDGEYSIDSYLKTLVTYNPVPSVTHKEALQIIANASRSVLAIGTNGELMIRSSFLPDMTTEATGASNQSDVSHLIDNENYFEYASLENIFTKTNRTQYFLPRNETEINCTGYVSEAISNDLGLFDVNPEVIINIESTFTFYNMTLEFGSIHPTEIVIHSFNNGIKVDTFTQVVSADKQSISHTFTDVDKVVLEFTKSAPHQRVHLKAIRFGDVTDYSLTYDDAYDSPTGEKQEKLKAVELVRTSYTKGTELAELGTERITAPTEDTLFKFEFTNPSHDYTAMCKYNDEVIPIDVEIVEYGTYGVTVLVKGSTDGRKIDVVVEGYEYGITAATDIYRSAATGKIRSWDNPLVSSYEDGKELAEWVSNFYSIGKKYDIEFRGEPALDCNDIIYLESSYAGNVLVRVEEIETDYNGAISGKVVARRFV